LEIKRKNTRLVRAGETLIGAGRPIVVQSMCATRTSDIEATLRQIEELRAHGAGLVRVAVDNRFDVEALKQIRARTSAGLAVDLQESYRLAAEVAPLVQKIRYNPGHLHHHDKEVSVAEKVRFITACAVRHGCALRIGINFGSLDPSRRADARGGAEIAFECAREHVAIMEKLGFENYVVSLKSSDPNEVAEINLRFAEEIPLHLGVTEAGLLPMGEIKTRAAFETLLAQGIGDTIRVSLTLPHERKFEEVLIGQGIIDDVYGGRFRSVPRFVHEGLNIVSCPSCSRVENERFVELAEKVRDLSRFAEREPFTIAVMGCRVNGPGETDDADLGLWCGQPCKPEEKRHLSWKLLL
jgi:(E)-4-hydroxy-3-methylbut-2-enyl-diphosphate synthase